MAKHVLIVGGGIIGICAAHYAMQRGHRITILERGAPDHDSCSLGNAGMIVPSHIVPLAAPGVVALAAKWMWNPQSPFYVKPRLSWDLLSWGLRFWSSSNTAHLARSAPLLRDLHFASRACYEELAESRSNDFGLVKKGLLMLCRTPHALEEEARAAEHARRHGIPAGVLDANQTAALEPGLQMSIAGSVHYPKDCHLSPNRFVAGLSRTLESSGAQFSWRTEATGWRARGPHIEAVRTNRGEIAADEFVLAGGSWSQAIARDLRLSLPLQAGKGYSLTLPSPRRLPVLCSILTEARVAVTPMGSALRFGGTMEIAGLDESVSAARVRGIIEAVPRYFPEFTPGDFRDIRPWRGLRPLSPDGLPYLGRTALYDNLIIATGHAMMGVSLGPISGKLVAQMLSGERPAIDIGLLSPDRYA
jgi:D-amino-acid dehydrogenase